MTDEGPENNEPIVDDVDVEVENTSTAHQNPAGKSQIPVLTFNPEDYAHHFKDMDVSEEEAHALLKMHFRVLLQFVDLGFEIHPIQQAMDDQDKSIPDVTKIALQTCTKKQQQKD